MNNNYINILHIHFEGKISLIRESKKSDNKKSNQNNSGMNKKKGKK